MIRTNIIQFLIDKIGAKKYLEIGVWNGTNFNKIICDYKISVDPASIVPVSFYLTSDDFFSQNEENFDIIFIDGLHLSEQVYTDIINSLKFLNEGGYIVCHDMSPHSELMQRYPQPQVGREWTGDCWKAWIKLRTERNDLLMHVVDTDYGCGIISLGEQKLIEVNEELTWDLLNNDRKNLLNLISVDEFKEIYGNR